MDGRFGTGGSHGAQNGPTTGRMSRYGPVGSELGLLGPSRWVQLMSVIAVVDAESRAEMLTAVTKKWSLYSHW